MTLKKRIAETLRTVAVVATNVAHELDPQPPTPQPIVTVSADPATWHWRQTG